MSGPLITYAGSLAQIAAPHAKRALINYGRGKAFELVGKAGRYAGKRFDDGVNNVIDRTGRYLKGIGGRKRTASDSGMLFTPKKYKAADLAAAKKRGGVTGGRNKITTSSRKRMSKKVPKKALKRRANNKKTKRRKTRKVKKAHKYSTILSLEFGGIQSDPQACYIGHGLGTGQMIYAVARTLVSFLYKKRSSVDTA